MILKPGIFFLKCADLPGEKSDLIGLGKSEIQVSARDVIERDEFPFDLICHTYKVLCAISEKHTLICQLDRECVTGEKLFAKLLLQSLQLF